MSENGHIVSTYNLKTVQQKYKVMQMECPHLSVASSRRICRLMVEQGLDGELDDFDTIHYCRGNPNHCYFYRLCSSQKTAVTPLEENKPDELTVLNEPIQSERLSLEDSDKLFKLRSFLHRIV